MASGCCSTTTLWRCITLLHSPHACAAASCNATFCVLGRKLTPRLSRSFTDLPLTSPRTPSRGTSSSTSPGSERGRTGKNTWFQLSVDGDSHSTLPSSVDLLLLSLCSSPLAFLPPASGLHFRTTKLKEGNRIISLHLLWPSLAHIQTRPKRSYIISVCTDVTCHPSLTRWSGLFFAWLFSLSACSTSQVDAEEWRKLVTDTVSWVDWGFMISQWLWSNIRELPKSVHANNTEAWFHSIKLLWDRYFDTNPKRSQTDLQSDWFLFWFCYLLRCLFLFVLWPVGRWVWRSSSKGCVWRRPD